MSRPHQQSIGVLDKLAELAKDHRSGRLFLHLGEVDVHALWGFIQGYRAARLAEGLDDSAYADFVTWLRDDIGEFPGEGWHLSYLAKSKGDQEAAIRAFFARVEEYRAIQQERP